MVIKRENFLSRNNILLNEKILYLTTRQFLLKEQRQVLIDGAGDGRSTQGGKGLNGKVEGSEDKIHPLTTCPQRCICKVKIIGGEDAH